MTPPSYDAALRFAAAVVEQEGAFLMVNIQQSWMQEPLWGFPLGAIVFGESVIDSSTRIVMEQTGYSVNASSILSIYTQWPGKDFRVQFNFWATLTVNGHRAETIAPEIKEVAWVTPETLHHRMNGGPLSGPSAFRMAHEALRGEKHPLSLLLAGQGIQKAT